MTTKSAFYPVLGDKIFGWMGDAIDTISVAVTIFGVCTSLGFGTLQIIGGALQPALCCPRCHAGLCTVSAVEDSQRCALRC